MVQGSERADCAGGTASAPDLPLLSGPVDSLAASAPPTRADQFVCPESKDVVSRGVHLSRLRRGYEECAGCPHRDDIGHLRPVLRRRGGETGGQSWMRPDGIRATYLNELTRPVMAGLAETVAAMLWEDLGGTADGSPSPVVVAGRDSRPMSADLAAGGVAGLRRMGCHVIDIGEVTRPEFWFAVRHLEAFAGVWVNGVGADANCGGVDIVQGSHCWSSPGRLDELWARREEHHSRPRSRNGTFATFQTTLAYLAGMRKQFHAFRPLSILIAFREAKVQRYLQSLLDESPIVAHWHAGSASIEEGIDSPLIATIQEQLYAQRLDAVIAIEEDVQTCRIWDERGRPVSAIHLLRPLLEVIDRRRMVRAAKQSPAVSDATKPEASRLGPDWLQARAAFVRSHRQAKGEISHPLQGEGRGGGEIQTTESEIAARVEGRFDTSQGGNAESDRRGVSSSSIIVSESLCDAESLGTEILRAGDTLEAMSRAMSEHKARLGLDARGAFWFDDAGPTCDVLLTVARLLQLLSHSDQPLSRLWAA